MHSCALFSVVIFCVRTVFTCVNVDITDDCLDDTGLVTTSRFLFVYVSSVDGRGGNTNIDFSMVVVVEDISARKRCPRRCAVHRFRFDRGRRQR